MTRAKPGGAPIADLRAAAYRIPTDSPEADGTFRWEATTLVVVEVGAADGKTGLGYTYADASIGSLIGGQLKKAIADRDSFDVPGCWLAMQRSVRNLGRSGLAACAISAVDAALWDLKARALDLPLALLLGRCREHVPIYGSGGFTSYSNAQLRDQLAGWVERDRCRFVKMKIGSEPDKDSERVAVAKRAIGDHQLFVDANGALSVKQALTLVTACAQVDIRWFEEPVTSDDLPGLRLMRERAPDQMEIAAGEYGYDLGYFRRMLAAGAVDVLQADATRCGGIPGFLKAAALCEANQVPMSAHTSPWLHTQVGCATVPSLHVEYFHDHVRIEQMFFDGIISPVNGRLRPDLSRPGMGIELKDADIRRFAA